MGIMITYGSYTGKEVNRSTAMVCVFDTVVALLAGLAIFPSVAHFDPSLLGSSKGVALMFIILPQVFSPWAAWVRSCRSRSSSWSTSRPSRPSCP